jgi:hypothetical protein
MLDQPPFFAQQGSYLVNQNQFGMQQAIVMHNQFHTVNVQRYQGVSAKKVQARQPALGCNTHLGTFRCEKISSTKASLVSNDPTSNGSGKSVFPFGPKHAEHARSLYQSKAPKPQFQQVLPQDKGRSYLFGYPVSGTKKQPNLYEKKTDDQVPCIVTCESREKVLKVASISTRPNKTQNNEVNKMKTFSGFVENGYNEKLDQLTTKKSIDFLNNNDNIDLSDAPIFQILSEIG